MRDDIPRSWFPSGLDEGKKVTLDKPSSSKWVIGKLVTGEWNLDVNAHKALFLISSIDAFKLSTDVGGNMRNQIMDDIPRSWFPSGLDEGKKVTLDKPSSSKWVIGVEMKIGRG
jgi:hypothetical protein